MAKGNTQIDDRFHHYATTKASTRAIVSFILCRVHSEIASSSSPKLRRFDYIPATAAAASTLCPHPASRSGVQLCPFGKNAFIFEQHIASVRFRSDRKRTSQISLPAVSQQSRTESICFFGQTATAAAAL